MEFRFSLLLANIYVAHKLYRNMACYIMYYNVKVKEDYYIHKYLLFIFIHILYISENEANFLISFKIGKPFTPQTISGMI